jgi:hypothetical protein
MPGIHVLLAVSARLKKKFRSRRNWENAVREVCDPGLSLICINAFVLC